MGDSIAVGILPLCRPTFDVEYARERLEDVLRAVRSAQCSIVGSPQLLLDNDAAKSALDDLMAHGIDCLLVVQTTFTDAECIVSIAERWKREFAVWAVTEPRSGGRLRLNSFCGLNLASHALGLRNVEFNWIHADAGQLEACLIRNLLQTIRPAKRGNLRVAAADASGRAAETIQSVRGARIGCIGRHPPGFDTCSHDDDVLHAIAEVAVEQIELPALFDAAAGVSDDQVNSARSLAGSLAGGLDEVDQSSLDQSLRLKPALEGLIKAKGLDALAVRCWPEMFTEHGGAVCGPVSMLGEERIPCACEADVYGALSQLILQEVASAPVFLADVVDFDASDDSCVVWHCGQAPMSMRNPNFQARATLHSNRKLPLLFEFPLKPGPVTMMRISKACNEHKMVLAAGEMLERPPSFSGTSGVVRFEQPAEIVRAGIIENRLEHHFAIAYGDHRRLLEGAAAELGLPLLEL